MSILFQSYKRGHVGSEFGGFAWDYTVGIMYWTPGLLDFQQQASFIHEPLSDRQILSLALLVSSTTPFIYFIIIIFGLRVAILGVTLGNSVLIELSHHIRVSEGRLLLLPFHSHFIPNDKNADGMFSIMSIIHCKKKTVH